MEKLKTVLRLCGAIVLGYCLACMVMVAATPKPQRYDCHGKSRQECFNDLMQSRRDKNPNRHLWFWKA